MAKRPTKEDLENIQSETFRFDMIWHEYKRLYRNPTGIDFKSFQDVCYLVGLPKVKTCETSDDFIKVAKAAGCTVEIVEDEKPSIKRRHLQNFRPKCPDCETLMKKGNLGVFECGNKDCLVISVKPSYLSSDDPYDQTKWKIIRAVVL